MLEKDDTTVSGSLPSTSYNVAASETFVDDDSSFDSIQFGVKQAEAVAAAWSRQSLVIAYIGYVCFLLLNLLLHPADQLHQGVRSVLRQLPAAADGQQS